MKYRNFTIRMVNLLAIAVLLTAYQYAMAYHAKQDQIAQLKNQVAQMEVQLKEADVSSDGESKAKTVASAYKDGVYTGEAEGFGGKIKVQVTVKDGVISQILILSATGEDTPYLNMAKAIIENMIQKQTADVDTVSGATYSSNGIKNAVILALQQAEQ